MIEKLTVKDFNFTGKRALVRVDFNVPLENGSVSDDTRIRSALPTIRYLLDQTASLVLCSHLGRPKGKVVPELSLEPVTKHLQSQVDVPVHFVDDCIGSKVREAVSSLKTREILVLENTRFYEGEKLNNPEFAFELASLADVFVNDAFGTAHRAHASNVGVAEHLPSVAGLLMEKEIQYLGQVIASPQRPLIAILGGAKVSDKIGVIESLFETADKVLIGGGMANTFFKAQGFQAGDSLVEDDSLMIAQNLLDKGSDQIELPVDVVLGDSFSAQAQHLTVPAGDIPDGWRILDIGSETITKYSELFDGAGTIVWNGPMGVTEFEVFAKGTYALAKAVADSSAITIIGGGDSVAAVNRSGLADRITHISTGGGAFLEMLEGKTLPGLAALNDRGE